MAYAAITVEGGFLPADLLDRIATGEGVGQAASDFGVEGRLSDAMQSAFSDSRAYWEAFTRRQATSRESATTLTRQTWITPLLETLGFPPLAFQRAALPAGGEAFPISHLAGDDPSAPPIHVVGFDQSLERRESGRRSPHALVQEYLNRSDALWGIVTNGKKLRLLRDSTRISHPVFIEFDLQGMIEGNLYSEFVLLYRLLHGSRFPRGAGDAAECILERLYQEGIDVGGRVRDKLRDGVERALNELGSGFLAHAESDALRARLQSGELTEAAYYRQLLRLVYRLLFMFVAEERRLLFDRMSATGREDRRDVYDRYYSVSRLRERGERPIADDRFSDLWPGLRATFGLFRYADQAAYFGLTALNGELFGAAACRDLEEAACDNAHLLRAIFHLSTFLDEGEQGGGRRRQPRRKAVRRRVNYAGLDVEELGSVYESLLDLQPAVDLDAERRFQLVASGERKQTGSYYTPSSLVHELIESALVPVMRDRLAQAKTAEHQERAILGMTVCDPAAGSGHFLLAAARRMGRELAKVRTGEAEPSPADFRLAERDVIRSCIYAVDKNPLAVDLCKVALWIEGHSTGLPLGFLDHHVKCGDSLVGVFNLDVLREGVPDGAYRPTTGDDDAVAKAVKKANKLRRESGQRALDGTGNGDAADPLGAQAGELRSLAEMPEQTPGDVHAKEDLYRALHEEGTTWWRYHIACDLWTAAFFAPLVATTRGSARQSLAPTTDDVFLALDRPAALHGQVVGQAQAVSQQVGFFHWPLEFPEVFARGGFDVVLGNPPWERTAFEDASFFASRRSEILEASTTALRKAAIERLSSEDPNLYQEYIMRRRLDEAANTYFSSSGRFPVGASGRLNTYALFTDLTLQLVRDSSRSGTVVQSGIATDAPMERFWRKLIDDGRIVSIFDFENTADLFPRVHKSFKFCLLTLRSASDMVSKFHCGLFLHRVEQINDRSTTYDMSISNLEIINPNTKQPPVCRSQYDLKLLTKIHNHHPILWQRGDPSWRARAWPALTSTSSSKYYQEFGDLIRMGGILESNQHIFLQEKIYVPLIESKMIHQYDLAFATYDGVSPHDIAAGNPRNLGSEEKRAVELARPRFWAEQGVVDALYAAKDWAKPWVLAYRDIARATDERTVIACLLPRVGLIQPLNGVLVPSAEESLLLIAALNSLPLDYIARQKTPGAHVNVTIFSQLPVPVIEPTSEIGRRIIECALELSFTSPALAPLAHEVGFNEQPAVLDESRKADLRAELDAIYAILYGFSVAEFGYLLDTFSSKRGLKEQDIREFGEYRTKRLCLEAYDRIAGEFPSLLASRPAGRKGVLTSTRDSEMRPSRQETPAVAAEPSSSTEGEALAEIVRRIVRVAAPERIVLFGSAARGEAGPNSDLDLLVIKPGQYHRGRLTDAIYRSLIGVGEAVDVVVVTPEDVERYRDALGLVIAPALREGRVIYAA